MVEENNLLFRFEKEKLKDENQLKENVKSLNLKYSLYKKIGKEIIKNPNPILAKINHFNLTENAVTFSINLEDLQDTRNTFIKVAYILLTFDSGEKRRINLNLKFPISMDERTQKTRRNIVLKEQGKILSDSDSSFEDSFLRFSKNLQESALTDILENRKPIIKFKLREYNVSIACRLLLLLKYLNKFLDDGLNNDIKDFLIQNFLRKRRGCP